MILNNNFYRMKAMHVGEKSISASIELDATHEVFKGHFPDQPIVPGVFQIQIIKEFLEEFANCKLQLSESKEIKFTRPITPDYFAPLNIVIDIKDKTDTEVIFSAQIKNEEAVFFKFRGQYNVVK